MILYDAMVLKKETSFHYTSMYEIFDLLHTFQYSYSNILNFIEKSQIKITEVGQREKMFLFR